MRIRARWCLPLLLLVAAACGSVSEADGDPDARVDQDDDAGGGDEEDAAVDPLCAEGMAFVPGGSYEMADLAGEVTVDPFCLDITHVTSRAYADCVSCSATNMTAECNAGVENRTNDPANCLDLAQAEFYCESVDKFVPTEQQWEWAARGGEAANTWAWGDDPPVEDDDRLCWWFGRDDQTFPDRPSGSCPVGFYDQKETHPFGLEDMTGNVWAWTTSVGTNADNRVVRGGGWDNTLPNRMRTGFRNDLIPATVRDQHLGFRCAAEPL
jgi:formylglycine-generating enzyme required for sulfatase activity